MALKPQDRRKLLDARARELTNTLADAMNKLTFARSQTAQLPQTQGDAFNISIAALLEEARVGIVKAQDQLAKFKEEPAEVPATPAPAPAPAPAPGT